MRALWMRWVARLLHPERFQRFRRRFDEHGNWATFCCRFLPLFRIPGYFVAGTMGMRYSRLLLLDGAGVILTVPISIYIGKVLALQTERLRVVVKDLHLILLVLVLTMTLAMVLRARRARLAELQRSRLREGDPPPPGPVP